MADDFQKGRLDIIETRVGLPYSITLKKMSKGFQWEIIVHGANLETVADQVDQINQRLAKTYGSPDGMSQL
ncbi:MAG: hypothetical protein ACYDAO_02505 [Thermoplasmataceae archaeon]